MEGKGAEREREQVSRKLFKRGGRGRGSRKRTLLLGGKELVIAKFSAPGFGRQMRR